RLELPDRPLDVARARANRARHPVHRAQLVDDRALDAGDRVRLELDVARGVERSIAPIRPSRPYETRSPSSTCAGSPLPSRPATYFTSGAYERISRSRRCWSRLRRYSRQSDCASSATAVEDIALRGRS